jgi:hypothetical protein
LQLELQHTPSTQNGTVVSHSALVVHGWPAPVRGTQVAPKQ